MDPFDGSFALNTIYPLAAQAYDEPFTLAGYVDVGEILVDTASASFQTSQTGVSSQNANGMLGSMLRPKGTGAVPSAAAIAAAEGMATGTADPDAPLPPVTLPQASVPDGADVPIDKRFGWVCVDETNSRLIVVFRGTHTAADWLNNIDFVQEPYRPIANAGKVHQGFQHVYYAIRDNLIELVTARLSGIKEILIAGHSLGGALTVLAMPDLLALIEGKGLGIKPVLYNLACPRTGDRTFQKFFNEQTPCWRIVNVWDVVPHVPPALAGYVHVGGQLTIDSGFSFDVAHNHVLTTGYLPGLQALVEKHAGTGGAAALPVSGREVPPGVSD